ncbi:MAG: hypothetical protein GY838_11745 [bacterium]|nr:hypothetical protein [bacterium]
MFLVEAIIALTVLLVVLSVGLLLLKFVFTVALIPIKIAFFLTKGLLGVLLVLPLLLIMGALITAVLPLGLVLLALPALLLGGLVCGLAGA